MPFSPNYGELDDLSVHSAASQLAVAHLFSPGFRLYIHQWTGRGRCFLQPFNKVENIPVMNVMSI